MLFNIHRYILNLNGCQWLSHYPNKDHNELFMTITINYIMRWSLVALMSNDDRFIITLSSSSFEFLSHILKDIHFLFYWLQSCVWFWSHFDWRFMIINRYSIYEHGCRTIGIIINWKLAHTYRNDTVFLRYLKGEN